MDKSHASRTRSRDTDNAGPLGALRSKLLNISSLSHPLQILISVVLVQLVLVGVLFALRSAPLSRMTSGVDEHGRLVQVPTVVYIITVASLTAGCTLLLLGAREASWRWRVALGAVVTGVLAWAPITQLLDTTNSPAAAPLATELRFAQVIVLIVPWFWLVRRSRLYEQQKPTDRGSYQSGWRMPRLAVVFLLAVLTYFLIDLWATHLWISRLTEQGLKAELTPPGVDILTRLLPGLLVGVVYWASTDFIESSEMAASGAAQLVERLRSPNLLYLFTAVGAAASAADVLWRYDFVHLLPSSLICLALVLVIAQLIRYVGMNANWPTSPPVAAVVAGAVLLVLLLQVGPTLAAAIAGLTGLPGSSVNPLYTLLASALCLGLVVSGIYLAKGQASRETGMRSAAGLFLAMLGLLVFAYNLPQLARDAGMPVDSSLQPNIAQFKLVACSATLVTLPWLALRGRLTRELTVPFRHVFIMLVALEVFGWNFQYLLPALTAVSSASVILAACLLSLAMVWDLATSGEVTNRSTSSFPRHSRVLLYLGYTLVASTVFLYQVSRTYVDNGHMLGTTGIIDPASVAGLMGLGIPLIAFSFVRGLAAWQGLQANPGHVGLAGGKTLLGKSAMIVAGVLAVTAIALGTVVHGPLGRPPADGRSGPIVSTPSLTAVIPGPVPSPTGTGILLVSTAVPTKTAVPHKRPTATPTARPTATPIVIIPSPIATPTPTPTPPPPPPTPHYYEIAGPGGSGTFTNYSNAGGTLGSRVPAYGTVEVSCRLTGWKAPDGDNWWYRIASSPWNNTFYASADNYYNNGQTSGSLAGTPFVDTNVPLC